LIPGPASSGSDTKKRRRTAVFKNNLLPGKSIDRSFEFNAVAPNGFLAVAYPSGFFDISWDDDDVVWRFPLLPSP
jgi:hypothetical protein